MSKIAELNKILEQLRELPTDDGHGDFEGGHVQADELLMATIRLLETPTNRAVLDSILEAYRNVGKWYA